MTVKNKVIENLLKEIEHGVSEVYESEGWKKHLDIVSKFHHYSLNNIFLIQVQKPNASLVAGFRKWKSEFNRNVKKGEKAIKIFAPLIVKEKNEKGEYDKVIKGFRYANVFDYSQTEGEELPLFEVRELKGEIENGDEIIDNLINQVHGLGLWFKFEEIEGNAKGYFSPIKRTIAIKSDMSQAQQIKTLIHELAHAKMHDINADFESSDTEVKEVQAESVAYVVANNLGLDTSEYSFKYIASWAKNKDKEEMQIILNSIKDTAHDIINNFDNLKGQAV